MDFELSSSDRSYLRELAKKQAEYAALPVMAERKQMWYDLNDGVPGARPPVVIETWTFDRDFMPEGTLRCESQLARGIESVLLHNIRNHEFLDDDKVIPDTFDIGWVVDIDQLGVAIGSHHVADSQGINLGYQYHHPIKNLKEDLHVLKPARCSVDRDASAQHKAFAEDLFDGILRVEMVTGTYGYNNLTHRVIELMGMQAFFMAMYDSPNELHQLMARLRDNSLSVMHWAESEGLLRLNNGNQGSGGSSYNFTRRLPADGYAPPAARLCDMWGSANSQETVGVSPELFHEFCFPYYRDVCEPLGLLYFGCCEPADPFWDDLSRLPHLKKISISRWCDQKFIGDALRGTDIVFSRKPDPRFIGVDVDLDEDAWRADVRETLDATRGVFTEFIYRDVYTVHGNLDKPKRAVQIAREEIDKARG